MSRSLDIAKILRATEIDNPTNARLITTPDDLGGGMDSAEVQGVGMLYVDTLDSLPLTNLQIGQQAFVDANRRHYVSNGSGWYNTQYVISSSPYWDSEPLSTYEIVDSATPLVITALARDSDNPNLINQSFGTDSAQYMATVTNDSSVFTFTPKTKAQLAAAISAGNLTDSDGDFIYTFKWSDGINFVAKAVTITYNTGGGGASVGGSRGIVAGNWTTDDQDDIDYFDINSAGTSSAFGSLNTPRGTLGSLSNGTRACFIGGTTSNYGGSAGALTNIEYVTTATTGNGTSLGNLTSTRMYITQSCLSDGTLGYIPGGGGASLTSDIDVFTVMTGGTCTSYGSLASARSGLTGISNTVRGIIVGGYLGGGSTYTNVIEYFSFGSTGTVSSFGTMSTGTAEGKGGAANSTRGVIAGGQTGGSVTTAIDYITLATTGNSSSFGSLNGNRNPCCGPTDGIKAAFVGLSGSTAIETITIDTTGNASSWGSLPGGSGGNRFQFGTASSGSDA